MLPELTIPRGSSIASYFIYFNLLRQLATDF